MLRIYGLTGGIGSGKSIVSKVFQTLCLPVYNADREAKRFLLCDEVVQLFGTTDSREIACSVFSDSEKLAALNAIIHPKVMSDFREWTMQFSDMELPFVLMESAIIFEANLASHFDKIITVEAPVELRISRVMQRDGMTEDNVRKRMAAQFSESERVERADFVIYNDNVHAVLLQVLAMMFSVRKF